MWQNSSRIPGFPVVEKIQEDFHDIHPGNTQTYSSCPLQYTGVALFEESYQITCLTLVRRLMFTLTRNQQFKADFSTMQQDNARCKQRLA